MPQQSSPQAAVPDRRDSFSLLQDSVMTQRGVVVFPPSLITANGTVLQKRSRMSFRVIQNCGTVPVKFLISNNEADQPTADMFHGILAGCVAQDDGTGSTQSFGITGDRVAILGVGGNPRVCVFEGAAPEGL